MKQDSLKVSLLSEINFYTKHVTQTSLKSKSLARIGLALGGGSARGYAHIGALDSLEQHGIKPNVIAGTSFGAVIGSFYAMGHTVEQLKEDARQTRRRDIIPHITDFGLHKAALFTGERLERYYERITEGRHFSDLEKELHIVTTDSDTGEMVLLNEGPLAPALRASCSMPGVFAPVELQGRRLMDGGLASPIPLRTLDTLKVDLAIGIGAGTRAEDSNAINFTRKFITTGIGERIHKGLNNSVNTHPLARLGRGLAYTANTYLVKLLHEESLQVHTNPPISWLHFHKAEQAIAAGEAAVNDFMPTILKAFQGLSLPALAAD